MSLELVKARLDGLLSRTAPRIVLLTGSWGVGKTHQWKQALRRYSEATPRRPPLKYAYVSLFGLDSLSDVRKRITEELVASVSIPGTGDVLADRVSPFTWRTKPLQLIKLLPAIPYLSTLENLAGELSFRLVKDAVICIDDLERAPHLSIADVLGLLSFLKDERNCRILILTNAGRLDENKKDLDKYLEKVVDEHLTLNPTPEQSAAIAVRDHRSVATAFLVENIVRLRMTNIRVISKLHALALEIEAALAQEHERTLRQAMVTLALFGVSHLTSSPDLPPLDYLASYGSQDWAKHFYGAADPDKMTPAQRQAAQWHDFLAEYGYGETDELDREIGLTVERGFVDAGTIGALAAPVSQRFREGDLRDLYTRARDLISDSFEDNTVAVIAAFNDVMEKAVGVLGVKDMAYVYDVLAELATPDRAREALEAFIRANQDQPGIFNISDEFFFDDLPATEFRARIEAEHRKFANERTSLESALKRLSHKDSWHPRDAGVIAEATVEEPLPLIREARGKELRDRLRGLLRLGRIGGDPAYRNAYEKGLDALRRIAAEGGINAFRVRPYLPAPAEKAVQAAPPQEPEAQGQG